MVLGSLRRIAPSLAFCAVVAAAPAVRAETAVAAVDAALAGPPPPPASEQAAESTRTRFVIGLDKFVIHQVFSLTNPNRVVVEIPDVNVRLPADPGGRTIGLVSGFQGGLSAPGKSRVVIQVTEPVVVESSKIVKSEDGKGHKLTLEIVPARVVVKTGSKKPLMPAPFALGATGLQPPMPLPAPRPDERAARSFKPIIVIDPGHGGHDSGAVKNGTVEKEVVLAFSKVLRDKIEATGRFRVLLTRDTDNFVELGERVAFAERHKANLFIAVHADYASTSARGATIYSLRDSVAESLKRSAKGDVTENLLTSSEAATVKETSGDIGAVKGILADLAKRELEVTSERTGLFSRSIIEYMGASTTMRGEPDMKAAFRVLKTAQFPSVLIELAYVTNKEDAELLKSDAWRDKVGNSILTAVETYFSQQIARLPM